jgi:hypothetical protein
VPAIQIEGLKELSKNLKRVSDQLPKELKAVSKDAAEIVASESRTMAPVLTGRLRDRVKAGATAKGADVRIMGLVYAPPIVFGWRKHNIRPNPFIYRALDKRRDEVIERFEKGVNALIEKTF